jgi:Ca2+-binding RTX toxin-like protein
MHRRLLTVLAGAALLGFYLPVAQATTPTCFGRAATIVGTIGTDSLIGTAHADVIVGLSGSDIIYGGGGRDRICGDGAGEYGGDFIYGQGGKDKLAGSAGGDVIFGGAGDDQLLGGSGGDQLDGGIGNDLIAGGSHAAHDVYDSVSYWRSTGAVEVNLSTGTATGQGTDTLRNIQTVDGSIYDDTITGNAAAYNQLRGRSGDDTIRTEAVRTLLEGGPGNDTLTGSDNNAVGTDHMLGRAGNDTLNGGGGPGDRLDGGPGNDIETGGSGNDFFYGYLDPKGSDSVYAMGGDDTIYINDGSNLGDYADAGDGTDRCYYDSRDTVISCEVQNPS